MILCSILNLTERLKFSNSDSRSKSLDFLCHYWNAVLQRIQNRVIRNVKIDGFSLNDEIRNEKVIVALTSFPARIKTVSLAIKTLFLQTYKPDRILLYLAANQFPGGTLPDELKELSRKGLEIVFVDDDLGPHDKYFHAVSAQRPDELVITFDDDIIYNLHSIEWLVKCHQNYPCCVVVSISEYAVFGSDGSLLPYCQWKRAKDLCCIPGFRNTPLTGSGCLYPYGSLREETFDKSVIRANALMADDLWIAVQLALTGTKVVSPVQNVKQLTAIRGSQRKALMSINVYEGGNEAVLTNLVNLYPEWLTLLQN